MAVRTDVNAADLGDAQKAIAQQIINRGVELGASQRDIAIALTTANRESDIRNLERPSADGFGSYGVFQGRATDHGQGDFGYGTRQQIIGDIQGQIDKFYLGTKPENNAGLLANPNRDSQDWGTAARFTQGYAIQHKPKYQEDSMAGRATKAIMLGQVPGIDISKLASAPATGGALYARGRPSQPGAIGTMIRPAQGAPAAPPQQQQQQAQQQPAVAGSGNNTASGGEQASNPWGDQFQRAVEEFKAREGTMYLFGGKGQGGPRSGIDCSGLVQQMYAAMGVPLGKLGWVNAAAMGTMGDRISISDAKEGDLIAWNRGNRNGGPGAEHIAVYDGKGGIWEAPRTGLPVRWRKLEAKEMSDSTVWAVDMSEKLTNRSLPPGKPAVPVQPLPPPTDVGSVGDKGDSKAPERISDAGYSAANGGYAPPKKNQFKQLAGAVGEGVGTGLQPMWEGANVVTGGGAGKAANFAGDVLDVATAPQQLLGDLFRPGVGAMFEGAGAVGGALKDWGGTMGKGLGAIGGRIMDGLSAGGSSPDPGQRPSLLGSQMVPGDYAMQRFEADLLRKGAGLAKPVLGAAGNMAGDVARNLTGVGLQSLQNPGYIPMTLGETLGDIGGGVLGVARAAGGALGNAGSAIGNVAGKVGGAIGGLFDGGGGGGGTGGPGPASFVPAAPPMARAAFSDAANLAMVEAQRAAAQQALANRGMAPPPMAPAVQGAQGRNSPGGGGFAPAAPTSTQASFVPGARVSDAGYTAAVEAARRAGLPSLAEAQAMAQKAGLFYSGSASGDVEYLAAGKYLSSQAERDAAYKAAYAANMASQLKTVPAGFTAASFEEAKRKSAENAGRNAIARVEAAAYDRTPAGQAAIARGAESTREHARWLGTDEGIRYIEQQRLEEQRRAQAARARAEQAAYANSGQQIPGWYGTAEQYNAYMSGQAATAHSQAIISQANATAAQNLARAQSALRASNNSTYAAPAAYNPAAQRAMSASNASTYAAPASSYVRPREPVITQPLNTGVPYGASIQEATGVPVYNSSAYSQAYQAAYNSPGPGATVYSGYNPNAPGTEPRISDAAYSAGAYNSTGNPNSYSAFGARISDAAYLAAADAQRAALAQQGF